MNWIVLLLIDLDRPFYRTPASFWKVLFFPFPVEEKPAEENSEVPVEEKVEEAPVEEIDAPKEESEEKIEEPDIFTEFGKYTVGESGAIIFSVIENFN